VHRLPPRRSLLLLALLGACSSSPARDKAPAAVDDAALAALSDDDKRSDDARPAACGPELVGEDIAPGLRVERIRAWIDPPLPVGDRCILLVRIDPRLYEMKLLSESEHGQRLSAPAWAAKFGLVAVTNASMFHDTGKSTGLMVNGKHVNNANVNTQFGAFMAFDPVDDKSPPVNIFGEGCDGFDLAKIRKDYRVVVQNYRLLGCDGSAIKWKDQKIYSAAAIAIDDADRVVFVLQRTPYRPTAFAQMLASDKLGLRAAMYVEGGPEASVYAKGTDVVINAIGSYESLFLENDGNVRAWPIPNAIGAAPR